MHCAPFDPAPTREILSRGKVARIRGVLDRRDARQFGEAFQVEEMAERFEFGLDMIWSWRQGREDRGSIEQFGEIQCL